MKTKVQFISEREQKQQKKLKPEPRLGLIKRHINTTPVYFYPLLVLLEVSPSEPAHPETELQNIFHVSPLPPVAFLCLSTHRSHSALNSGWLLAGAQWGWEGFLSQPTVRSDHESVELKN